MPQVLLNEPEADAGFKQVCRVAVTERVQGNVLADAELSDDTAHRSLYGVAGHGCRWRSRLPMVGVGGGKQPAWMSVSQPVLAKNRQGTRWQRHVTVFGSLAKMHMHKHPLRVDVADLQMQAFLKSQAERIDCPEKSPEVWLAHGVDELSYLIDGQHVWESSCPGDSDLLESFPVARYGVVVEEFEAARGNLQCAGREFFAILEVEQIFADLALGELVGRLLK